MTRRAIIGDIDRLMELCREHYQMVDMENRGYGTFDEIVSKATLTKYIEMSETFCVFIDNKYNGVIAFMVAPCPYSADIVAVELLWYARSKALALRLFDVMEHFCDMLHVKKISIGIPSYVGMNAKSFLERKRYAETDIIMRRRV